MGIVDMNNVKERGEKPSLDAPIWKNCINIH